MQVVSVSTKSYKDLLVWQKAVDIAVDIYSITKNFPNIQQYGLGRQLERAAVSIPSNVAEGAGRKGTKEFIQHLSIAKGSLYELETQLIIANKVGFIQEKQLNSMTTKIEEVGRMLSGLKSSLEKNL